MFLLIQFKVIFDQQLQQMQKQLKLQTLNSKQIINKQQKYYMRQNQIKNLGKFKIRDVIIQQKLNQTEGNQDNICLEFKNSPKNMQFSQEYSNMIQKIKTKSHNSNKHNKSLALNKNISIIKNQKLIKLIRQDKYQRSQQTGVPTIIHRYYRNQQKNGINKNQDIHDRNSIINNHIQQVYEDQKDSIIDKQDNQINSIIRLQEEQKLLPQIQNTFKKRNNSNFHQSHIVQSVEKKINLNYAHLQKFGFHIDIIIELYEAFNHQEDLRQNEITLSGMINNYLLTKRKVIMVENEEKYLIDDVSSLDTIYLLQKDRRYIRYLILLQRILLVMCLDLMANQKLNKYIFEINQVLLNLVGMYIYLFYNCHQNKIETASQYCTKCIFSFQRKMHQYSIHMKKDISLTTSFIYKKLFPILKTNYCMFNQIKQIIHSSVEINYNISRSFYELLNCYAIYLNENEVIIHKNYNLLKNVTTCPSPYLLNQSSKKYTLVLNLEQTLVHLEQDKKTLQIYLRPYTKQFLKCLSQHYEIIIFTSFLPRFSLQIIQKLPFIQKSLFRFHLTRLKNRTIKDLNRIGRRLQNIILIDKDQQAFVLQPNNGIKLNLWTGDNILDKELSILAIFLTELVKKNIKDVRQQVIGYKKFRERYH